MAHHAAAETLPSDFFEMSLSELANIKVTSVSKRAEVASEAASAIYVITQDDIRRSGLTSIPEILRLAPGIQVARAGTHEWAISARGFNAQFANKLLVLIDGRTVYNPVFSGVFWNMQDLVLDDIERIEVIRGPGATIWGANAVNGVINIITKQTGDTTADVAKTLVGNYERIASYRHGGELEDGGSYRVYAKGTDYSSFDTVTGRDNADEWNNLTSGFRYDNDADADTYSLQGSVFSSDEGALITVPRLMTSPFSTTFVDDYDRLAANLMGTWARDYDNGQLGIQTYYDHQMVNTSYVDLATNQFDADAIYTFNAIGNHDLTVGGGYRLIHTSIDNTGYISYSPATKFDHLFNAFFQDRYALLPDELYFTYGSKFEHNDYTGFEVQPSARLTWLPSDNHTFWGSVSRAVRTPNRSQHHGSIAVITNPLVPAIVTQIGQSNVGSEELAAYELGYRYEASDDLQLDTTAFYNDYPTLVSDAMGAPFLGTGNPVFGTYPVIPFYVGDDADGETYGFEMAANWQIANQWLLKGTYSLLKINLDGGSTFVSAEGTSPEHQWSLRSHYTFENGIEFDQVAYYVSELHPTTTTSIDDYLRLDLRLAYQLENGPELSLVGQNLLDNSHQEFGSFLYTQAVEIPRTIYGQVKWQF